MKELPMKEILAGLRLMIETKLKEPGVTHEQHATLKEVKIEIDSIAAKQWRVEDLTELNTRLEKVTEKLNKAKDT